jgi:flagellar hook-associated protein 1 FlgK
VISAQVDAARESVAGVNIDEEMTNMLSYQHAYSAAGRLVTAIDEMLDVLINRTGRVGL